MAYNKGATFVTSRYQVDGETLDIQEALNETIEDVKGRVLWLTSEENLASLPSDYMVSNLTVRVSGSERAGEFIWVQGDLSSEVSADVQQGIYVPPSTDTTGASGAWMRKYNLWEGVNPEWFGASGDGVTDCYEAFQAALDTGRYVYIPQADVSFYLSQPVEAPQNLRIRGTQEVHSTAVVSTRIYAPNGFIKNTDANRKFYVLENLEIFGDRTAGSVGLSGKFGGRLQGNYIHDFGTLIENESSYALSFVRNQFNYSDIALRLGDPNFTVVDNNWFGSSCGMFFDCESISDLEGKPLSILRNNFNIGPSITKSVIRIGQLIFNENYIEFFSAASSDVMLDILCERFSYPTLEMKNNQVNGQSEQERWVRLYSDNASGTTCLGEIKFNYMRGFTSPPIIIGGDANGYDLVMGMDISRNQASQTQYVEYSSGLNRVPLEQNFTLETSVVTDVSGTSFVTIPFENTNAQPVSVTDGVVSVVSDGDYLVTVCVEAIYTAEYRSFEMALRVDGAAVIQRVNTLSGIVSGGNNYQTISLQGIVTLTRGQELYFNCRNGESVGESMMSIKKLSDSSQYLSV